MSLTKVPYEVSTGLAKSDLSNVVATTGRTALSVDSAAEVTTKIDDSVGDLSGVTNAATARTALSVDSSSGVDTKISDSVGDLSGVTNASAARTALGVQGTASPAFTGAVTSADGFDSLTTSTTDAPVVVGAAAPPTTGQVLTATSAVAADWQTPAPAGRVLITSIVPGAVNSINMSWTGYTDVVIVASQLVTAFLAPSLRFLNGATPLTAAQYYQLALGSSSESLGRTTSQTSGKPSNSGGVTGISFVITPLGSTTSANSPGYSCFFTGNSLWATHTLVSYNPTALADGLQLNCGLLTAGLGVINIYGTAI